MIDKMRQYLSGLDIDTEQKKYAINFCKKVQYLDTLHNVAIDNTNNYVNTGYGNVNSQICFVFNNKEEYKVLKPAIVEMLEKFNINIWNVYITFVNKTESDYTKKYSFLANEIHAIGSNLMFVFDKDDNIYNQIIESFNSYGIALPQKHFFIDICKFISTEPEDKQTLWSSFRYLINYKEIEQEE